MFMFIEDNHKIFFIHSIYLKLSFYEIWNEIVKAMKIKKGHHSKTLEYANYIMLREILTIRTKHIYMTHY